jgi:hypothetical protein
VKRFRYFLLICGALAGCAHPEHDATASQLPERLPPAYIIDGVQPEYVWQNFDTLHPWRPGNALPRSFSEAGLDVPVELVGGDISLDGGARYYIFRGGNNRYLFLCTDKEGTTLYIHAYCPAKHSLTVVPHGSESERFLFDAIKKAVAELDSKSAIGTMPRKGRTSRYSTTIMSVTDRAAHAPRQP